MKSRCSLAFHELENGLVNDFATGVQTGVNGDPVKFPDPPFTTDEINALIVTYTLTFGAWEGGGNDQRGAFVDAKAALMTALDDYAAFVDGIAKGNETIIVAGGFSPIKTTREPKPEPKIPTGTKGVAKINGIIETECDRMDNADYYGAVCSTSATSLNNIFADGQFNFSALNGMFILIDMNKDRVKTFSGCTGGTNYYIQFYCANGKGTSLLGEPVRVMATE